MMMWLFCLNLLHATTEKHPKWLDATIESLRSEGEPIEITRWRFKGRIVYVIPKRCCDIPTEVFSVGGERLCVMGGDFGNTHTPYCDGFEKTAKRLATVWTNKPK